MKQTEVFLVVLFEVEQVLGQEGDNYYSGHISTNYYIQFGYYDYSICPHRSSKRIINEIEQWIIQSYYSFYGHQISLLVAPLVG